MGREARCEATIGDSGGAVKAHLDTGVVRVRGAFRLDAAFADIRNLAVRGDALHFTTRGEGVTLVLGAGEAAKWLESIRRPKTLLEKLGIEAGMRVCVRAVDDATLIGDLSARLGDTPVTALRGRFDAILAQFDAPADLRQLDALREHLEPDGMLWLIAPKSSCVLSRCVVQHERDPLPR
jgi:hypothetical protein